jgi:hypothetical protein
MKKIMEIDIPGYDFMVVDVSTPELLNKAYKWIFKHCGAIEQMEDEIKEVKENEEGLTYMKDCAFCDKTGKVVVKDRTISCPECGGLKLDEWSAKEWNQRLETYHKALKGDIKAIKKAVEEHAGVEPQDEYPIRKVVALK